MSDEIRRLALAIHEADLGARCKARGPEKARHVDAYVSTATAFVDRLARRWEPKNPPPDVFQTKPGHSA